MENIHAKLQVDPDFFGRFQYPTHPFSMDLCQRLSSLPQGFIELGLMSLLSERSIRVLELISEWDKARSITYCSFTRAKTNRSNGALCVWLYKIAGFH